MDFLNITGVIKSFKPTGLDEMDNIRLMDRFETKYLLTVSRLPEILEKAGDRYKVLEINEQRDFEYHNVYLDTPDYSFFNEHVTGKLERYKVRFRRYVNTGSTFLEIKRRSNKNRTKKWRISSQLSNENNYDIEATKFIDAHLSFRYPALRPVLINRFRRFTLAGYETDERITIDYDLRFSDAAGSFARFPYLSIIEVKRDGFKNGSLISEILKERRIHSAGFSKYCIGAAAMKELPHKNNLKSKFLILNKIEDEYFRNVYA